MKMCKDDKNHFAEIEYCIKNAFQCRVLATEATMAIIGQALLF